MDQAENQRERGEEGIGTSEDSVGAERRRSPSLSGRSELTASAHSCRRNHCMPHTMALFFVGVSLCNSLSLSMYTDSCGLSHSPLSLARILPVCISRYAPPFPTFPHLSIYAGSRFRSTSPPPRNPFAAYSNGRQLGPPDVEEFMYFRTSNIGRRYVSLFPMFKKYI